jgi:parallel beta-helix repeat protein
VVGSTTNTIQRNSFTGGLQGITLEQGSSNNIVQDNTITGSGKHGIYFKTGKNTISNNSVTHNGSLIGGVASGSGIASYADGDLAVALADLRLPGSTHSIAEDDSDLLYPQAQVSPVAGNQIVGNTVLNNADRGIELKSADGTHIKSNTITGNGSHGIYLASGATNSLIELNTINGNKGQGIRANGLDVAGNQWSKNLVYDNLAGGIVITSGGNNGIPAPTVEQDGKSVTITTQPGAMVEIFSDDSGQGRFFEARIKATSDTITLSRSWKGAKVNATVTDADGNSSGFAFNRALAPGDIASRVFLPLIGR